jgi:hypothetical protein
LSGFDWDPAFAYYAGRRALMRPAWLEWDSPAFQQALDSIDSSSLGALLVCRQFRDVSHAGSAWSLWAEGLSMAASSPLCDFYVPPE